MKKLKAHRSFATVPMTYIVLGVNPRKSMDDEKFLALKSSIEEEGQLQPVLLQTIAKNQYKLIAGFRRFKAMKELGYKDILAIVDPTEDELQAHVCSLIENIQREEMNPFDEAQAMQAILDDENMTQSELAEKLGVSSAYVSLRLRLLDNATEELIDAVKDGTITATSATEIAALPTTEQKEVIEQAEAEQAKGNKFTTQTVKNEVEKRKKKTSDPDLSSVASDLRDRLKNGNLRTKNEIIAGAVQLATKYYADNKTNTQAKAVLKGQLAFAEWVLSLTETVKS